MPIETGDPTEPQVGERTDGERDSHVGQAADQRRILQRPVAVIDAIDLEQIHRVGDVGRGALLSGVGDHFETRRARRGEQALKLARRMALLRRVEAKAGDSPVGDPGLGLAKRGEAVVLGQMPQDAQDEQRGDAELHPPVVERGHNAVGRGREGDAASGVSLRVVEHLDVNRTVGGGTLQVGHGEIVEVLLDPQHVHALVVDVEEVLQLGEVVGGPNLLDRAKRNLHIVPGRQTHQHFRLQRALQVHVELGLGQAPDKRSHVHARLPFDWRVHRSHMPDRARTRRSTTVTA